MSIKEFIDKNRGGFDVQLPPQEAWQKIERALPQAAKQAFWNSVSFWRMAAAILLGLSAYLFVAKDYSRPNKKEMAELQGFSDLELYYSGQINEKMDLVHRYQIQTGLMEDEVTQNLKKLEAMYLVLKNQMKRRPTQVVRDALVLNLLVRIDLINQQLNKLDKPETQRNVKSTVNS